MFFRLKFLVALTLLGLGSQCLAKPTNDHEHHWERFKDLKKCRYNTSNIGAICKGYIRIHRDEESLKHALAAVGPISICVVAYIEDWKEYKGGVLNIPDCPNTTKYISHAVLLADYGQENGMDYWLVKNSWGESWCEKGYIKMSRNKNNQCGIATYATYPIV
ncbi:hypothetical protein LAZ67_1002902 [Cordylochernes scorpioides]|uniref:Peptidase C1A papain C-terminal domain-containing protein n=1 Tax=Cordylochernes scorpioides TaxID=51811 RepID=A0ABY6JY13_9ARAC|nr:hypothetical protein LAZ67_1002902 [Cordylochernes scorpioides]